MSVGGVFGTIMSFERALYFDKEFRGEQKYGFQDMEFEMNILFMNVG